MSLSFLSSPTARIQRIALTVSALLAIGLLPPHPVHVRTAPPAEIHTPWRYPFDSQYRLGETFEQPESEYGAGHRGIDFLTFPGTPVLAPAGGTVHFSGTVANKPVITIRVDEATLYTFEPVVSTLSVGEPVYQGSVLGEVNEGGHCRADCVHLGVRIDGEYVNPLRFFAHKPRLLPVGQ